MTAFHATAIPIVSLIHMLKVEWPHHPPPLLPFGASEPEGLSYLVYFWVWQQINPSMWKLSTYEVKRSIQSFHGNASRGEGKRGPLFTGTNKEEFFTWGKTKGYSVESGNQFRTHSPQSGHDDNAWTQPGWSTGRRFLLFVFTWVNDVTHLHNWETFSSRMGWYIRKPFEFRKPACKYFQKPPQFSLSLSTLYLMERFPPLNPPFWDIMTAKRTLASGRWGNRGFCRIRGACVLLPNCGMIELHFPGAACNHLRPRSASAQVACEYRKSSGNSS